MFEDKLPCKTMLAVNDMGVKVANTHLCLGTHGVVVYMYVHIKSLLTTMGMQVLFVVNPVKLHLTAFNIYHDHSFIRPQSTLTKTVQVLSD